MSESIDLERNYEVPETGKSKKSNEKKKGEKINIDKRADEDGEEPLPGLSGTRWSTVLMISLWIVCVVLTAFVSPNWTSVDCDIDNTDDNVEETCIEHGIVNRVASVFVLFFALQGLLSIFFVKFFDNFWIFKFLGVAGLSLLLLIPNTSFFDNEGYQYIARIGGFLFIIFLQVLLLDFCYYWKKGFIDKSSTSSRLTAEVASDCTSALNNVWLCALLAFSLVYILIFIAAMSLLFAYFAKDGCDANKTIITISLVMMLCALVMQVVVSKNGSIIASGILSCYVAYLTYSAVALNPSAACNPTITDAKLYGVGPKVIGLVLSFLAIVYASVLVTRRMSAIMSAGGFTSSGFMNVASGRHSEKQSDTKNQLEKSLRTTIMNLHVIFIMLSFYISMTLTNWGTLPEPTEGQDHESTNAGNVSMWMQACGAWIAIALYVLGLIVPNFKFFPRSIWDLRTKS